MQLNYSLCKTSQQIFECSNLIKQQITNRKVQATTTGKKLPRRTSMSIRQTSTRNSSSQSNVWFHIMFNLLKACETLSSTSQNQTISPLNGKLGTAQPYVKRDGTAPFATQLVGVDSIQPSKFSSKCHVNVFTERTYVPRQSGYVFQ